MKSYLSGAFFSQHMRSFFRWLYAFAAFILWFALMPSCGTIEWSITPESGDCNPNTKRILTQSSLWKETFGGTQEAAHGCLRATWSASNSEASGTLVQIDEHGVVRAYAENAENLEEKPIQLTLPRETTPSLELFVFGRSQHNKALSVQRRHCQQVMGTPQYQCTPNEQGDCWFAWRFAPSPSAGAAPQATALQCTMLLPPPSDSEGTVPDEISGSGEVGLADATTPDALPDSIQDDQEPGEIIIRQDRSDGGVIVRDETQRDVVPDMTPDSAPDSPQVEAIQGDSTPPQDNAPPDNSNNPCGGVRPCIETFAGSATGSPGFLNGPGNAAKFQLPRAATLDDQGNVYISDTENFRIRKIDTSGVVTTYAGTGISQQSDNTDALKASFKTPDGLVFDTTGSLYVGEYNNRSIRRIDPQGSRSVTTHQQGGIDSPRSMVWDPSGAIFLVDSGNARIAKILLGSLQTFAGGLNNIYFPNPAGLARDDKTGSFFVSNPGNTLGNNNHAIYKVDSTGQSIKIFAGQVNQQGGYSNGPATTAAFNGPRDLAIDPGKRILYVADSLNHCIRKILIDTQVVSILAGTAGFPGLKDGIGTQAQFNSPFGLALDTKRQILYVVDTNNNAIRRIWLP